MSPQVLVVGHVVQDLNSPGGGDAWHLGETAVYASLLTHRLDLQTALLPNACGSILG